MLTLAPGVEVVPGYKLVKPLGQGGFGEVWQAEAPGGFAVALKFIRLDTTHAEPELRALEVIRDIRHPHLLDIQFAVQIEDRLVIAMPLCDRSVWDRYQECRGAGEVGIGPEELLRYMGECALALDFLNEPREGPGGRKGVAHRDVKPHNIFLVGGSVRLADFGLAKILERSVASHTGSMTPAYAPPEMFARKVSAQSDQWSLAVTYMQMRTGVLPFVGSVHEMVFSIMKDEPDLAFLPEDERAVIARALEKDPKDRWPSCGVLVEALRVAARVPVGAGARVGIAPSHAEGAPPAPERQEPRRGAERPEEKSTGTAQAEDTNKQPVKAGAGAARYATFDRQAETKEPAQGQPRWAAEKKAKRRGVGVVTVAVLGLALLAAGVAAVYVRTDKGKLAPPVAKAGEVITNSIGMKLVLIPAGEFEMGSRETAVELARIYDRKSEDFKDEYPLHKVRITKPFYLGQYEVTRGQFLAFYNGTKYQTDAEKDGKGGYGIEGTDSVKQKPEFSWHSWGFKQNDNHPVVNVSWNDAEAYCEWLSKKEGKEYRLPTEAEWEYACRAGTKTRYWHGDDAEGLARIGNVSDQSNARNFYPNIAENREYFIGGDDGHAATAPVGSYRANAFGLYDMHGNASEWCSDLYREDYYAWSPRDDPAGPSRGSDRVFRGGGWGGRPVDCRSAVRGRVSPEDRGSVQGFRVALSSGKE